MSLQLNNFPAHELTTCDRTCNRRFVRVAALLIVCCLFTLLSGQVANAQPSAGPPEPSPFGRPEVLPFQNLSQSGSAISHQANRDGTITIKGTNIAVHATAFDWSIYGASSVVKIEGKAVRPGLSQEKHGSMNQHLPGKFVLSNGNGTSAAVPLHPGVYVEEIATGLRKPATRVPGAVSAMTIPRGSLPAKPSAVPATRDPYGHFNFKVSLGR